MKNFRLVFIIMLSLFLVGCSGEENLDTIYYDLDISTMFEERITVFLDKDAYKIAKENQEQEQSSTSLEYELLYEDIEPVFSNHVDIYSKDIDKRLKDIKVDLRYNYIEEDFIYSNNIMNCFENYDVISNENSLEIYLSGEFYCLRDKSNVNIRVSSAFEVESSNGELEEDTYIWNINEENASNVNISHVILRNYEGMNDDRTSVAIGNEDSSDTMSIVKVVVLVLILGVLFIIKKKYVNNS